MGIRAEDTYFEPLEEIGTRLSKDRALTLFETSENIRWLMEKWILMEIAICFHFK